MNDYYQELYQRILDMADGDEEFRIELTSAIYNGLLELQSKYSEGVGTKNEVIIQQIRHKIKPTLSMFEFVQVADSLQEGKEILESEGFGPSFEIHFQSFLQKVGDALAAVSRLSN